jgi:hypothetical protein
VTTSSPLHDHLHAGPAQVAHGRARSLPDRVREGDEAAEFQALDMLVGDRLERLAELGRALGHREHTIAAPRQAHAPLQQPLAHGIGELDRAVALPRATPGQHDFGRALDADQIPTGHAGQAGVVAAAGLEGQLAHALQRLQPVEPVQPFGAAHPDLPGAVDERAIGHVRQLVAVLALGRCAHGHGEDVPVLGIERFEIHLGLAVRDGAQADAALGQRAGLVGAEQVHAAQGLDRARVAHQRAVPGQAARGRPHRHRSEHGQFHGLCPQFFSRYPTYAPDKRRHPSA